jgi:hypothetical protein
MREELKPCPCCGSPAVKWVSGGPGCHYAKCEGCGLTSSDGSKDRIAAAWNRRAPDAALIEAGDRLNELACHQDDCQIVTHGVWSDPIPCSCGYTEAWKKWKEVRGE